MKTDYRSAGISELQGTLSFDVVYYTAHQGLTNEELGAKMRDLVARYQADCIAARATQVMGAV